MKYVVTVGGREITVDLAGERVVVDGAELDAEVARVPGSPLYHLLLGGEAHTIAAERPERGRWRLTVDGEPMEVEALDERTHAIRQLSGGTKARTGDGVITAPMPGLVVRLLVSPGDLVTAGQGLVVLEAMKMENELQAAAPATVRSVLVGAGAAVEKGTPLVELGAPPESG